MANILEGIEFRTITYNGYGNHSYTPWTNATGDKYPAGSEFRQRPYFAGSIEYSNKNIESFGNKDKMMAAISSLIDEGMQFTVISTKPMDTLEHRKLQVRYSAWSNTSDWIDVLKFSDIPANAVVDFRIRPDFKYIVQHDHKGIVSGARIEFDDVNKLNEYVQKQITTNNIGFSVKAVEY